MWQNRFLSICFHIFLPGGRGHVELENHQASFSVPILVITLLDFLSLLFSLTFFLFLLFCETSNV